MTEKIKKMLDRLTQRTYKSRRVQIDKVDVDHCWDLSDQVDAFKKFASMEKPLLFEDDSLGFNRYVNCRAPHRAGNVTPNYGRILDRGLEAKMQEIRSSMEKTADENKLTYGKTMLELLSVCLEIAEKYRIHAQGAGNTRLYQALSKIPAKGAESFYEALVFMKMCTYCLRLYGAAHLTLGRFDQYMYPFYENSKQAGIGDEALLEMLEEFFISLNYDTDLYPGIQQGDNGQSMVLGGFDKDGNSMYNPLSQLCMQASLELSIIDPKINLRVGKNTPDSLYEYATLLTKQGLGFPQYCNDDVVVPGLIKLGYAPEDALNYTVAACWEFIVPNCGADWPNVETMDFPQVVNRAIVSNLQACEDFDSLMACVANELEAEADILAESARRREIAPMPLLSVFMDGCIENLTDMWRGGTKYQNFGCHGAGIANAADALSAVKMMVFDKKQIRKQELLDALAANFENYTEIREMLRNCPKMGNNDDYVDEIACQLMGMFSATMNRRENGWGGIWRAGTGSAMEYLWKGEKCPATADGRKAGEPYSSSFSPSLDVKPSGLLSVIQSFTKYDMTEIINGGPLTIEIHDTVLRNDIGIQKTAMLVKNFIQLGGHQLQLNSINRDRLLDAQKHPENYPNLIVRVWGWSGYFNELDVKYQNHIIRRCEFAG